MCERKAADAVGPLGAVAVGVASDSGENGLSEEAVYTSNSKFMVDAVLVTRSYLGPYWDEGRDAFSTGSALAPGWNALTGSASNSWFPVQGSIPEEYGSMIKLETLALPGLQLNGSLPTSMSNLKVRLCSKADV
jgi:hypothetical protein